MSSQQLVDNLQSLAIILVGLAVVGHIIVSWWYER